MDKLFPKSYKQETKPHLFCPGCGHAAILKQLGEAIDELGVQKNMALGIDIGCSLLAWNFFDIDTAQTHHGRTASVMVGYKMARPERLAVAYMGDGGAYAIGLQSLLHAVLRNEPITVIVVNNENYSMTGGQKSPTTRKSAEGGDLRGFKGPEMISHLAAKNAWVGRGSVGNPRQLRVLFKKALANQMENKSFSFLEVLSICPVNWKTDAAASFERLKEMEKIYSLGEIKIDDEKN
ncbi:MAG TPA: thiamine pyrophosphate-dependent enzyme [Candidatus Portnoybacteria bacterium]|nr:thiamine pyrophosphate-dependent enzyme [Candidatus Portnoybacteria bacterium]